ncbi:MAG: ParB/RepB/Spo0J family partition protein [Henriciella sp.]|nr:ParB/RepB/Spo0J family partition protein [Henriciella sp.]
MANHQVKSIALNELKVSTLNMRHGRRKPDISDILPSIRTHGVRQSLLVRAEGDKYGVIAGRRRLFALKQVAKETGKDVRVPCIVMKSASEAEAIEASLIENVARMPATEMEQYTSFNQLHQTGRTVDEIADYYGITPLTVKRVLALANLIEPIRNAYSADEIDRETIRALTLATVDQQTEWIELFQGEGRAPRGRACRAWITGGDVITTEKALFDLATYDGTVVTDLFGDHGVFADPEAFWQAQSTAISAKIEAYREAGWSDVHVLERGRYFQSWEHEHCARTKGGHVFVELRHNGEVVFHEAFVTKAEAKRREKTSDSASKTGSIASEMSGPTLTYISRHRHGAAAASLLEAPAIALRLMVAHALAGSSLWDVRPQPDNVKKETSAESLNTSRAATAMTGATKSVSGLFEALGASLPKRGYCEITLCETFSALLAMSDEEVSAVLAFVMAKTLLAGGPTVEAVLHVLDVDLSEFWSPDAAFFDLLRDKRIINTMLSDITSDETANAMLSETGKAQKAAIIEAVSDHPDWRPAWMQMPPKRMIETAGSAPAHAWESVKDMFKHESEPGEDTEVQGGPAKAA